ncbi:MAG: transketolase C-terminal domain-containing protein [Verrucomicrobiia bacterium]
MRNAFADEITQLASHDERVVLLMGDIGNRLFDKFKAAYPNRFYNCGVAEANMISLAAGLAACGLRPVCYTITPFITYRVMEQIRLDLCYHHQPVIFVGTGAGLSYASLGATHHSLEEMGMLRLLPHLKVTCPGDAMELRAVLRAALEQDDPLYLRIGKKGEPVIHPEIPSITLGQALPLRTHGRLALLSAGNMLPTALASADLLSAHGIAARVYSFHTLKPLDTNLLAHLAPSCEILATIEEHSTLGGLGTAVAEWLADHPSPSRLIRFGTRDEFMHEAGEQEHARHLFNLTPEAISNHLLQAIQA